MELNFIVLLGLFTFSAFLLQIGVYQKKYTGFVFITTAMFIPILLATFREASTDIKVYESIFNSFKGLNLVEIIHIRGMKEFGDTLFTYIGTSLNSFQLYLFLYSFTNILMILLIIKKMVPKDLSGITFFLYLCMYYPASLNIMRQSLAVALILFSFQFIMKKNFIKFLIWIIIAVQFHLSALIILPVYFILNKENKIRWKLLLLFAILILFSISNYQLIFSTISLLLNDDRYNYYTFYTEAINNNIFFFNSFIFFCCLFVGKYTGKLSKEFNFYLCLLLLGLLFSLTGFTSPYIKRVAMFFDIVQIILIPQLFLKVIYKKERNLVVFLLYVFAFTYFLIFYVYLKFSGIIPFYINVYN